MRYLQREDLTEVIQEYFLDDSKQFDDKVTDGLEEKAIAFAISYIDGRYKTDEIFGDSVKRTPLLVMVIARLVVYWTVRRNAARKVPEDYKAIYDEAVAILTKIQTGVQTLPEGMPPITGGDGSSSSAALMYGNTTNDDNFI
jgi:hypothetical protein